VTALRARQVVVALVTAAALVALLAAGRGHMPPLPRRSWSEVEAWYETAGPVPIAMHLVRGLAVAGALWLLCAALLQLVASILLGGSLARVADAISPRLLRQAAHLSIAAGLAVPSSAGMPSSDPPGTAVMQVLEAGADDASTTTTTTVASTLPPTTAPTTSTTRTVDPPDPPRPPAPPAPPPPVVAVPGGEEIVVRAGDSFWSIATDVLAEVRGRGVTDREVHGYWRRLIQANRAQLVEPGNPDLLLPDQRLVLPRP
jgi:hypothetical protein